MTEDELITLGDYSEQILTHPLFNTILNEWDKSAVQVMLATKPDQQAERERLFSSVNAVREFLGFMQGFVKGRNDLRNPQSVHADLDDPSVHDIYNQD